METVRSDYINEGNISILFGIFRNKIVLVVFTTIVILIIMVVSAQANASSNWVSNSVSVVIAPLQKAFSFVGSEISKKISYMKNIEAIKAENEYLKNLIAVLEKQNRELLRYEEENVALREALNIKDQFNDYETLGANIIARDLGNWFNLITVDRGIKDGIDLKRKDLISNYFPVITNRGLVGRVLSSATVSSKIITILDEDSTVMGRIVSNNELVRVKGDVGLKEQNLCRIDYISPDADIVAGDMIETSGLGGIFPKGILIGKVIEVRMSNSSANKYAIVEPAVDFKKIDKIIILKSKLKELD